MPTTIAGLVAGQLVSVLRGVSGFRSPATDGAGIPVFDSTEVFLVEDASPDYVVVGEPGNPSGAGEPGRSEQAPSGMAASNRPGEERGSVTGTIVAQSGDSTLGAPKVVRDRAYGYLQAVDAQLRGTAAGPFLGIDPASGNGQLLWARLASHSRVEVADEDAGLSCELTFTIEYLARI